ncbi:unnamed protein product [Caenorhabditis brenneri]
MRHSINTLQWVAIAARKSNKTIGMKLIHEVIQKEKGGATSIFDDWSAVLELTKHADVKGGIKAVRERVLAIEKISAEHGGEDRFVSGLHANYLVSLPIGVIRRASTWFSFYDDIQKTIHTYQNWSVQKYMFSVFVSLHLNIATHARVPIQYPHLEQTMFQKMKESEETINAVRSCGHSGRGAPKKELLLDVLPFIVGIVQPPIKPMNESLYNQRELATFNQTVSIMCDYGLTYTATMVKDQVNWLFTPSIDVLTMFPLEDPKRQYLANATRQLIAHKITLMRVRLADSTSHQSLSEKISTNTDKIKDIIDSENRKKKRLSAGEMKRVQNGKLSDILFTHQDGDSSAVKKKVTMQQLNKIIFGEDAETTFRLDSNWYLRRLDLIKLQSIKSRNPDSDARFFQNDELCLDPAFVQLLARSSLRKIESNSGMEYCGLDKINNPSTYCTGKLSSMNDRCIRYLGNIIYTNGVGDYSENINATKIPQADIKK